LPGGGRGAKLRRMPELPEAECVRQTLTPKLTGRRVASVRVGLAKIARPDPSAFGKGLKGRTVVSTGRHGKMLLIYLDDGAIWNIHLGMTGQVILAAKRPKAKHIHITVGFSDGGDRLYYRDMRQFGFMGYWPDEEALRKGPLKNFGPDALLISPQEFTSALAGRKAPLKNLLLDQRILAGVGNIYADEALHRAGLSPLAKPVDLKSAQFAELHAQIQITLKDALSKGGSSVRNFVDAEGRAGTFQHAHRVYRRGGQPCGVCGGTIQRVVLAGRSTHYCPCCQSDTV
jgi:formamidopyrimidine-DNA glycosylase